MVSEHSLPEFVALKKGHPLIEAFFHAYRRRMDSDPTQFKPMRTIGDWETEFGIFIDVGGDADE